MKNPSSELQVSHFVFLTINSVAECSDIFRFSGYFYSTDYQSLSAKFEAMSFPQTK